MDHLMTNYARLDVTFTHGKGALIWDKDGNEYLDALGGIAVCALGHAHPNVQQAICDQAGKLLHTSNIYQIENQQQLADKLCELSGMDNVFFSNSGAEANEAAIKLARLYGRSKKVETPTLIVTEGSFHGRTLATLTATGNRKIQAGFEPLVRGFVRAPYNDIDAIKNIGKNDKEVVGVMVEPITGEGGIVIPDQDYLIKLRELCDKHDWLLILDEIQTGMGRTGKWFAHQYQDIKPDVMTLAKALGNGVPIGACLARGKAAELFKPGHHGSTYGGNPLACRAGLSVIETIEQDNLIERVSELSELFATGFKQSLASQPNVTAIRIKGLMIGIELTGDCSGLVKQALAKGLLINVTAGNVIRLLPPYVMTDEQAQQVIRIVSELVIANQEQTKATA